jgi:hypothetical protein
VSGSEQGQVAGSRVYENSASIKRGIFLDYLKTINFLRRILINVQGGSNMTGTNCDLFTHRSSRSYLNHLVVS